MKRMITLLLALMLLTSQASAETLREQVGAPESVQTVYYSNTRKTEVLVQADVIVPDRDHIDTYEVEARDTTIQDAMLLSTACVPESDWEEDWVRTYVDPVTHKEELWQGDPDALYEYRLGENDEYHESKARFLWEPENKPPEDSYPYGLTYVTNSKLETAWGLRPTMRRAVYEYMCDYNVPYYNLETSVSCMDTSASQDADRIQGQLMTWEEATTMATAFAERILSSYELVYHGAVDGWITYHDEKKDTYDTKISPRAAYVFCFVRVVDGIPLTYATNFREYDATEERYAPPPGKEYLCCIIDQERIVNAKLETPISIGNVLSRNVQLLPFDQIMAIFGQVCPLTVQYLENENQDMGGEGNRWEINEIRLGYMPVLRRDGSGLWELRPVWDFIGTHIFAHEYYNYAGNTALTIDAIDGTVIDRKYGY